MKKQKIGIDIRSIGQKRTGDETYTLNLVRELLRIDKKNQYFLLTDIEKNEKIERKIFFGIKNKNAKIITVLPSSKFFWTFFLLPKMAKKLELDILHVQYIVPFWLSKKVKLITTIADVSFKVYPEFINKLDLFFLNILIPLSLKRADKIIAVSEFTRKEIIKYYQINFDKITTIHNGEANEIFFSKKQENKKQILDKLGIKKPYLFYVGTHQPRKDIPTLIQAFLKLKIEHSQKKEIVNLQLVIGGRMNAHNYDPRIDEILAEAKKNSEQKTFLKDLIFTGYIKEDELPVLYQEADIFVFPSLYEGFGLPLLEAMISEVPVICSNIECSKEIGGSASEFYKAKDAKDLERILLKVIINPKIKTKMVEKGLENLKKYSWKKTAWKTLQVFLEK